MLRATGDTSAAPVPCNGRGMIKAEEEFASAFASDATVKIVTPSVNTRRRPNRSADRPPSSKKPGEGECVGGDDPLQIRGREAQVPRDRGQRDICDGGVQNHHELGQAHGDDERRLGVRGNGRLNCGCSRHGPVLFVHRRVMLWPAW